MTGKTLLLVDRPNYQLGCLGVTHASGNPDTPTHAPRLAGNGYKPLLYYVIIIPILLSCLNVLAQCRLVLVETEPEPMTSTGHPASTGLFIVGNE